MCLVPARNQNLCHQCQAWAKLQLALCLLLLTILRLCHHPALPSPPVSNSSCLFPRCQPLCASYCTTVLFKVLYCKIKNVLFCVFFAYYLYEKYHKPITVQYYMGFPGGSDGKESVCNVADVGLIPGLGRSPRGGNDYPLQYWRIPIQFQYNSLAWRIPWTEEPGGP